MATSAFSKDSCSVNKIRKETGLVNTMGRSLSCYIEARGSGEGDSSELLVLAQAGVGTPACVERPLLTARGSGLLPCLNVS